MYHLGRWRSWGPTRPDSQRKSLGVSDKPDRDKIREVSFNRARTGAVGMRVHGLFSLGRRSVLWSAEMPMRSSNLQKLPSQLGRSLGDSVAFFGTFSPAVEMEVSQTPPLYYWYTLILLRMHALWQTSLAVASRFVVGPLFLRSRPTAVHLRPPVSQGMSTVD